MKIEKFRKILKIKISKIYLKINNIRENNNNKIIIPKLIHSKFKIQKLYCNSNNKINKQKIYKTITKM